MGTEALVESSTGLNRVTQLDTATPRGGGAVTQLDTATPYASATTYTLGYLIYTLRCGDPCGGLP